jgi:hypothetical protein
MLRLNYAFGLVMGLIFVLLLNLDCNKNLTFKVGLNFARLF